ncbi:MAG: AI-2E family transporter [Gammaproteobacteria bacterium]|nr:AI-2E family transporter [Gammaproteobacteria bacterium]
MILTEQRIYWLLIAITFVYLIDLLSPILGPFLFSALLAYMGDPVVDKLEKHFSRTFSVCIVFFTILLVLILTILVFIPLVSEQLSILLTKAPSAIEFIHNKIVPVLEKQFQYEPNTGKDAIMNVIRSNFNDLPSLVSKGFAWLTSSSGYLMAFFANVFLVPVVTFYLLRDWDILVAKVHALLPRQQEGKITELARESNDMLAAFLRGQFAVMNALGLIYAVGLSVVGLDSAILIGFIAGWLSFVPYLGLVVGFAVATVMAYFQFGDFAHPLGVIVVFVFAQALEGSFLTPRFVGERIGLHPVAVIFAVLAGGQLAGFSGVLLALPIAAVLNVLMSHVQVAYQQSRLYNKHPHEQGELSE